MTEKTKNRIHLIYHILVSVMLIVAGLCLMVACVDIYRSGDRPFSRQAVAVAFSKIAVPVYFALGLVVAGFLLEALVPHTKKHRSPEKQYAVILEKLQQKLDLSLCDDALHGKILAEQNRRRIHRSVTLALLATGSAVFLSFGIDPRNFPLDAATEAITRSMYLLLPVMAIPCGFGIFAAYAEKKSLAREIGLTRQAIREGAVREGQNSLASVSPEDSRILVLRLAFLTLAVGCIVYGAMSGGTDKVLTKAINICTECVGLG